MIKLIINPDKIPLVHTFNRPTVVIGSASSTYADLTLPNENLQNIHIKIETHGDNYLVINQANDPFVTLNGLPFGKKILKNLDLLQVGNTLIRFESQKEIVKGQKANPILREEFADTEDKLPSILEQAISQKSATFSKNSKAKESFDIQSQLEKLEDLAQKMEDSDEWKDEELADMDIDSLIAQVEELEKRKEGNENITPSNSPFYSNPEKERQYSQNTSPTSSLKDSYLSIYDDVTEKMSKGKSPFAALQTPWNWRLISWIAGLVILALFFIGTLFYLYINQKNSEEEFRAAEGVTDVSMALTYAQMHNLKPQNQNWADPEFLKNNLLAVLAPEFSPVFSLDNHGQFSNNNYLVRIYTSNDLSQFVVIAQPAPSILQWLIPKATIIVDSHSMELHKISDLKALNRLLLNPTTLEGANSQEVSHLVKLGDVIALHTLSAKNEKHGFAPPKALSLIRPGTENLIYNAPRYYRFGETFMKQGLLLLENPSDSHEVEVLQNEMKALSRYPNIVLYTSLGLEWATHAQKALNTFVPQNKLLIAYLKFSSKGTLASSHLLMAEGIGEIATASPSYPLQGHLKEKELPAKEKNLHAPINENIEKNHPLYLQLTSLKSDLMSDLKSYDLEVQELLNTPNRSTLISFLTRMDQILKKGAQSYKNQPDKLAITTQALAFIRKVNHLLKRYESDLKEKNENTLHALTKLYQEYSEMPLEKFIDYVKAAELEFFVKEQLFSEEDEIADNSPPDLQIEGTLEHIRDASTLQQLHNSVDTASKLLNLQHVPDPKKLMAFQSHIRNQVIEKLNDFLLSSDKALSQEEFKEENRPTLAQILKTSWITDPDEFEFYMSEFEVRSGP